MSSRFLDPVQVVCALALLVCCCHAESRDLVVCADPDNLPFSHQDGSGFENLIAALIAQEIDAHLVYRWLPLRRGAVRKTLGAGLCDILMGVPAGLAGVITTIPYYRSSYALVTRQEWGAPVASFDDQRIRSSRIGVPLIGAEGAAAPPALALARRGMLDNVEGFPVYGALPVAQRMVDALATRQLDIAVGWGPGMGYYVRRGTVPMDIALAPDENSALESFSIAIALRDAERELRDELSATLERQQPRIDKILRDYGVPLLSLPNTARGEP